MKSRICALLCLLFVTVLWLQTIMYNAFTAKQFFIAFAITALVYTVLELLSMFALKICVTMLATLISIFDTAKSNAANNKDNTSNNTNNTNKYDAE